MKILLLNNSGLISEKDDFSVDAKTGAFGKELYELGHQITFWGQKLPNSNNTVSIFNIIKNGMQVAGVKRKRNKLLNYIMLFLSSIRYILTTDFIYIFYPNSLSFVALIAIIFRKKFGLYIRGIDHLNSRLSKILFSKSYAVFTVSDYFTEFVNSTTKSKKASTIRPMISFNYTDIVKDRKYLIKEKYNLLFLGRMTEDKGIIELLKAVSILKENDTKFFVKLVGNGEYIEDLKILASELKINHLVSFEGGVYEKNKIKAYYEEADIYVLPTYHGEGFPRTLYEAMTFGTPIVTTFVGGIPALMKADFNCLEIEPKNVEHLVITLKKVMQNYSQVTTLAKNASETVKKILDPNRLSHAQDLNQSLIMMFRK